ncbi:MAG: tRNA lysidine(34) synthetase TilS [Gammaproteobacteria bacterium]|nr:tRNA lysidine(34) synthetase TilS [Gammaproteobacteria bacterium]
MSFNADQLIAKVLALAPDATGYWVAYSGGLDSQVLLHALAAGRERLPAPLGALHVNHNLQADAPAWAEHCSAVCAALGIDYQVLSVQAQPQPGESPEAAARAARYRALAAAVPAGGVVLTAHHRDDQAETLLLQLLRGAGSKGLAAMPEISRIGDATLLRPLLDVGREALHDYARSQGLSWVDDPSNAHTDYDRNCLRHEILPRLRTRWPAAGETLARGARHQAEAAQLLEALAELDWQHCQEQPSAASVEQPSSRRMPGSRESDWKRTLDPGMRRDDEKNTTHALSPCRSMLPPLSVSVLLRLSAPRRANLLRHWLHRQGAPMPSTVVLERVDSDLLHAAHDAEPLVRWGAVRLRRYRDGLYLDDVLEESDPSRCLDWQRSQSMSLPGGVLSAADVYGEGVASRHLTGGNLQVRFRQGGESLQPVGRREHHSLKHLFQEAGVPPWERARVPLIYRGDTLIAVAGYWVCAEFQARADEPGVRFSWSRAIVHTGSFW